MPLWCRVSTTPKAEWKPQPQTVEELRITRGQVFGVIALIDFLSTIYAITLSNAVVASPLSYEFFTAIGIFLWSCIWLITAPIRFIFYLGMAGGGDC